MPETTHVIYTCEILYEREYFPLLCRVIIMKMNDYFGR